jgi:hypothetical protein
MVKGGTVEGYKVDGNMVSVAKIAWWVRGKLRISVVYLHC